jgi:hypothetical protein
VAEVWGGAAVVGAVASPRPSAEIVIPADNCDRVKKSILLYGVIGGLLVALLKVIEYRYFVPEHSIEIYGGLIAALFAALS